MVAHPQDPTLPVVAHVRFVPATAEDDRAGLLGYVSCTLAGAVALAGIALRRTAAGDLRLSFPESTDRAGRRHAYFRPLDDRTRQHLEREILKALGPAVSP